MQKKEFLLEAELKANAVKYFPNFYGNDFTILRNKNLKDLREEYLKYCEKYFVRIGLDDDNEKINIKKAYDYMKNILENRAITYQSKSKITNQILNAYENLMNGISNYSFCPRKTNSYGANQNRTNKQIIMEISLLRPVLTVVLENIDGHFEKIEDVTQISCFDNQLVKKLEELIKELNEAEEYLTASENNYHNKWDLANGRHYGRHTTKYNLGKSKKAWKSARNDACSTILYFYREMQEINMSLQTENMTSEMEEINALYSYGLENIINGPNYYCYLDSEERKSIIEEKVLKKQK